MLTCTLDDRPEHDRLLAAWRQERSVLIWLFDDARLSAATIRQIMAMTEPDAMIAAIGPVAGREAQCRGDSSGANWRLGRIRAIPVSNCCGCSINRELRPKDKAAMARQGLLKPARAWISAARLVTTD